MDSVHDFWMNPDSRSRSCYLRLWTWGISLPAVSDKKFIFVQKTCMDQLPLSAKASGIFVEAGRHKRTQHHGNIYGENSAGFMALRRAWSIKVLCSESSCLSQKHQTEKSLVMTITSVLATCCHDTSKMVQERFHKVCDVCQISPCSSCTALLHNYGKRQGLKTETTKFHVTWLRTSWAPVGKFSNFQDFEQTQKITWGSILKSDFVIFYEVMCKVSAEFGAIRTHSFCGNLGKFLMTKPQNFTTSLPPKIGTGRRIG